MKLTSNNKNKVIVVGAGSLVGHFLLSRLQLANYDVIALSRKKYISDSNIHWHQFDGGSLLSATPAIKQANVLIHLGPLRTLPNLIEGFASLGGNQVIAFSSTSRFSKLESSHHAERKLAEDLIAAEDSVAEASLKQNINWTILRPTLIYGAGLDNNVSSIARFIKRFGFFPIVGDGSGLRQPVHADDLARACVTIIGKSGASNKSYDLIGGETLSYKEMVEHVFITLNKKPRFVSVPLPIFRLAMTGAALLPAYSHVTPDMANRMNNHLCFDSEQAVADFGYKNRGFSPKKEDLDSTLLQIIYKVKNT